MENFKISFVGDISLNDAYVELYKSGAKPFDKVSKHFEKSDFVVGNLECIVKGLMGENQLKKPRLTTTVQTLNYLKDMHLSVACLAHNHVYDHLEDGLKTTINFLNDNSILHQGASFTYEGAAKPIVLEKNGVKVALLNYVDKDTKPNMPENSPVKINWFNQEQIKADILDLKKSVDHLVLILHWGGMAEGKLYPDPNLRSIAYDLIDSGADLIIGGHSHTIHPIECYKGKYIFYSLGNFCFADIVFEGKILYQDKLRRSKGLVLDVQITKDNIEIVGTFSVKNKELFLELKERKISLKPIIWRLIYKYKFIYDIYSFYEKVYKYFSILLVNGLNNRKTFQHSIKLIRKRLI
jgi:hypothetical protein